MGGTCDDQVVLLCNPVCNTNYAYNGVLARRPQSTVQSVALALLPKRNGQSRKRLPSPPGAACLRVCGG